MNLSLYKIKKIYSYRLAFMLIAVESTWVVNGVFAIKVFWLRKMGANLLN
jgi:hypothetical protein